MFIQNRFRSIDVSQWHFPAKKYEFSTKSWILDEICRFWILRKSNPFPYSRILCTIHVRTYSNPSFPSPILVISILRGRLTKYRALHVVSCHVRIDSRPRCARRVSNRVSCLLIRQAKRMHKITTSKSPLMIHHNGKTKF